MGQINASDNAFGLLFFVMIWTLSTSQHISRYLSNDLHVSDQIKAFQKLLCLCAVPSAWHGFPISTCLTPSCSWELHLNIPSSDKHSLNCPRHGSPPSSSGLPQCPVHTSITPFDMWYYNFLFTCQVHRTVTLWKHGLSVCLLWFYFCFSAPCQV